MRNARVFAGITLGLFLGGILFSAQARAEKRVALIYADSTAHTLRTISGIIWSLTNSVPQCDIEEYYLSDLDPSRADKVNAGKPDIVVTIGTSATAFANKNIPGIPLIFAKVLNPVESGFIKSFDDPGGRITGAALDIPADQQVTQFLSILPNMKKIGMIYTERTERLQEAADDACRKNGLELISIEIKSSKELPGVLDSLCQVVDGFWTVADESLASPQFIRYMVLETMRHGIPIMGFNRNFVQNGALLCLEADYKFIGRQAGDIVVKVLKGEKPSDIKPTVPDIVYLYLNLKSSNLLNINLAPEWISVARETF
jgi:putative ABC transport system substrate-binding protein